jgi:hypothetical protein
MKDIIINNFEKRLEQIKEEILELVYEKYHRTEDIIALKDELYLNDKRVTHILYRDLY